MTDELTRRAEAIRTEAYDVCGPSEYIRVGYLSMKMAELEMKVEELTRRIVKDGDDSG